ncbi:MAG TPA: LuxR family transcriptional regulator [Micropepsaceae bacterium]|nr:LuxR family transcriptional regulator [Micropepsaceae bacterium]
MTTEGRPAASILDGFASALEACSDLQAVAALFGETLQPLHFSASACGAFLPSGTGPVPHFYFQNWPKGWMELYQERNFVAVDYGVAEARRRIEPFTWNEAKAERKLSRAEIELWDVVNEWGWHDGYSVPIHGPGGYFAIVTMASTFTRIPQELRLTLRMLALLTHDRCRRLAGKRLVGDLASPLTARELECLRWVAAGKTDNEIGLIMGLSPNTVKTHLDVARRKLDAANRSQAVARLIYAGLS